MKHLLGLKDTSKEEIENILETARGMQVILDSNIKKAPHLNGKSIVTLFYENSTRTRLSLSWHRNICPAHLQTLQHRQAVLQKEKPSWTQAGPFSAWERT